MKSRISLITLFFLFAFRLIADNAAYLIKSFNKVDGLPGTGIYCMTQDSMGAMWFGCEGSISRYDGFSFRNYPVPLIGVTHVVAMENLPGGNMLLLGNNGHLYVFDGMEFQPFILEKKYLDCFFTSILYHHDSLFLGFKTGLLVQKGSQTVQLRVTDAPTKQISVEKISKDRNGFVYVTTDSSVYKLQVNGLQIIHSGLGSPEKEFMLHSKGSYWCSIRNGGFYRNYNHNWEKIPECGNSMVLDVKENQNTEIWVATGKGLYRIVDNLYREVYVFQEIKDEIITNVFVDKDNNLWAVSYGKGIYRFIRNHFTNFSYPAINPEKTAKVLLKDSQGGVWTYSGATILFRFHDGKLDHHFLDGLLKDKYVHYAVEYGTSIVFGGEKLLMEYQGSSFKKFPDKGLPANYIIPHLGIYRKGELIASVINHGLWTFQQGCWQQLDFIDSDEKVQTMLNDSAGNFWISTNKGLFAITNGLKIKMSTETEIKVLQQSPDKSVYAATKGRVLTISDKPVKEFFKLEGMLSGIEIRSFKMLDDRMYIGTNQGLAVYKNGSLSLLTSHDGIASDKIVGNIIEESQGKIYFATINGFTAYSYLYEKDSFAVNTSIGEMITNKETLTFNLLKPDIPDKVNLRAGTKNIVIKMSITDQNGAFRHFRYCLGPVNDHTDWKFNASPEISLLDMDAGNYQLTFQGMGINNDWKTLSSLEINIKQFFYKSWLAKTGYLLVVIGFVLWLVLRKKVKAANKYKTSSLTVDKAGIIFGELEKMIKDEKLYREPELSLELLAKRLHCSKEHISQVINEKYKKNFNVWINYFRIEEARQLLIKERNKTIIEIAYQVGFNSKSSFNTAFKNSTNQTPTEYRKKQVKD